MSLLTIVQGACLRCNVTVPTLVMANSDPTIQAFAAHAQDSGDELAERWTWLVLKRPASASLSTITGDGVTTVFNLPSDWGRLSPSDVLTSSIYPTLTLSGPINEGDLVRLKQLPFTPLPSVWRLLGTTAKTYQIEFYPALANGEIVSFVYGTLLWITNSSGTVYANGQFAADSDISLIHDRLVRLGTIWRWKKSKGLSYAEEFNMYERSFDRRAGQESQVRVIRMSNEPLRGEEWFPGSITDLTSHIGVTGT